MLVATRSVFVASILALAVLTACSDDTDTGGSGGSGASSGQGGSAGGGAVGGMTGSGGNGASGGGGGGPIGVPYAFVGLSNGDVLVHDVNLATGELTLLHTVAAGANPSFLAVDPSRSYLYAINEGSSEVASFAIDPSADLLFLNRVPSGGSGPAHIAVDATGGWVMTANYSGGSMSIFAVQGDGSLGTADVTATGSQAHWVGTDASNQFLFVPNKGTDAVSQFTFDGGSGQVTPNSPAQVSTANGAGPRHLAFHPNGSFAYVINELDDTMTAYTFDAGAGTLTPIHTLSTLPGGANGNNNTCAEVVVSPDGSTLYGSNRGHDSIVAFAIDAGTGMMTLIGHETTDIATPRSFAIDPTGTLMLVANQGTNSVAAFAIGAGGVLSHLVTTPMPGSPPFVGIFDLPTR